MNSGKIGEKFEKTIFYFLFFPLNFNNKIYSVIPFFFHIQPKLDMWERNKHVQIDSDDTSLSTSLSSITIPCSPSLLFHPSTLSIP